MKTVNEIMEFYTEDNMKEFWKSAIDAAINIVQGDIIMDYPLTPYQEQYNNRIAALIKRIGELK